MKRLKIVFALILAICMSVSFTACGLRDEGEKVDPNKTQIRVGYYDGGCGNEWLYEAKRLYEAENSNIQILVHPDKKRYESSAMLASYFSYDEDIFFVDTAAYTDFKNDNFYYDLTETLSTPLTEFGETRSILDKVNPQFASYYNEGTTETPRYLAMPFYESFYSMIYDVELFETRSLYMDGNGGYTNGANGKSLGKDGIAGTYDDGLPATVEEFFALCDHMIGESITPFTWTGNYPYYPTKMIESYWASYEGYDNYLLNYTLDSKGENYEFPDGTTEPLTVDNGYKLKSQQGRIAGLEFMYRILNGNGGRYYSDSVFSTGQDNMKAQDEFLFSNKNSGSVQPIAFLIDGTWWEREASNSFKSVVARTKDNNDAYGKRRFGVMPFPTAHSGQGTTDVYSTVGNESQVFINKNTKVPEEAKKFYRFLHTDRIMSLMTGYSNTLRPYSYTVASSDYERMTPFGKQISEIIDTSRQSYARRVPSLCVSEFAKKSTAPFFGWQRWTYPVYPAQFFHASAKRTVEDYMQADEVLISATEWQTELNKWRNAT